MTRFKGYKPSNDDSELGGLLPSQQKSCSRESEYRSRLLRFVEMHSGLLLVGAAQAFFALMDLAVKLLNEIGPPSQLFR